MVQDKLNNMSTKQLKELLNDMRSRSGLDASDNKIKRQDILKQIKELRQNQLQKNISYSLSDRYDREACAFPECTTLVDGSRRFCSKHKKIWDKWLREYNKGLTDMKSCPAPMMYRGRPKYKPKPCKICGMNFEDHPKVTICPKCKEERMTKECEIPGCKNQTESHEQYCSKCAKLISNWKLVLKHYEKPSPRRNMRDTSNIVKSLFLTGEQYATWRIKQTNSRPLAIVIRKIVDDPIAEKSFNDMVSKHPNDPIWPYLAQDPITKDFRGNCPLLKDCEDFDNDHIKREMLHRDVVAEKAFHIRSSQLQKICKEIYFSAIEPEMKKGKYKSSIQYIDGDDIDVLSVLEKDYGYDICLEDEETDDKTTTIKYTISWSPRNKQEENVS